MNLKIRDYNDNDFNQVKEIILHGENFGEPFLDIELERIKHYQTVPTLGRILVAEQESTEKLVGFVSLEFAWRSLEIKAIITHVEHLRKGIGRNLIKKSIKLGNETRDINVIRVNTGDFMKYAQNFYLACGFQICGFVSHDISWHNHQVHLVYPLEEKIPDLDH